MAWKANGNMDLPLAERDHDWDGDGARERIFRWAGWEEDPNPEKARQGFFAYDDEHPEHKHAYKLPFADVIGGRLMAVPHGIFAAAAVLEGARGGVELPDDVIESVRQKVTAYYRKMGEQPPW
jgi:hypothetical protein